MKKLLLLAVLVGACLLVRKLRADRLEWKGLTEAEARAKMTDKLSGKMSAEQVDAITTLVVTKLKSRGLLASESPA